MAGSRISPILDLFQKVQPGRFERGLNLLARHAGKIVEERLQSITRAQIGRRGS